MVELRLKSLSSLGQTMRGLGLMLFSLIHFQEAERCLRLANSFEGKKERRATRERGG